MGAWLRNVVVGFWVWLSNIWLAVVTVAQALWVTIRYWVITYNPKRGVFTEMYEYPELPVRMSGRFRGFHRYDLTTCIGCERCAKDCPVNCIYITKERAVGRKGFQVKSFAIDYTKCMFCALCTESCPVDSIFMGSTYDLSCYSRDGCIVDFARLPVEVAWGRSSLNPTAVARSKSVVGPVHDGPGS
jgi:NADH-quinone oxidoreductase subunit I